MIVEGLALSPNRSPESYVGSHLFIDGVERKLGRLIAVGAEKYVYELDEDHVFKIYRDLTGQTWVKDQEGIEIFEKVSRETGGAVGSLRTEFGRLVDRESVVAYVAVQEKAKGVRGEFRVDAFIHDDGSVEIEDVRRAPTIYDKANSLIGAGFRYEQEGRYEEALRSYDAALGEQIPDQAVGLIWFNKGNVFGELGQGRSAEDAYLRALRASLPDEQTAHAFNNLLILLFNETGRFHEALVCAEVATKRSPKAAALWLHKAAALYYLDRYAEAVAAAEHVMRMDPGDTEAGQIRARALHHVDRMERLVNDGLREIKRDQRSVKGWHRCMIGLLNLDRVGEAFAMSEAALSINNHWGEIYTARSAGWLARGKWTDAIRDAERAMTLAGENSSAEYLRNAGQRAESFSRRLMGG